MHNYLSLFSENHTVEVILPMGATEIKVNIPFDIDEIDYSGRSFKTLDVVGAPKIVIKVKNASAHLHNKDFEVSYKLQSYWLIAKPLVMAGTMFVFCLLVII